MDERAKELTAIGASVGGHCQPCLEYHIGKARNLGVTEEDIQDAVKIGFTVGKGAENAMRKYADELLADNSRPLAGPLGTGSGA